MKEKLLSSLKTKFKNLGFGGKAFDGVAEYLSKTVTDEANIETAISGVEPLLKSFQGDIDKVRNEKSDLQRKIDELEKKNLKPTDPPKPNDPPAPGNDEPEWFKNYRKQQDEATAALKQKLDGYEAKEKQTTYLSKVKAALKDKNVPDSFWKKRGVKVESDEQLEAVIAEIESDWTEFKQEQVNAGVMLDIPKSSDGKAKEGAELAKTIAEKRNSNASDGVKGKEI